MISGLTQSTNKLFPFDWANAEIILEHNESTRKAFLLDWVKGNIEYVIPFPVDSV